MLKINHVTTLTKELRRRQQMVIPAKIKRVTSHQIKQILEYKGCIDVVAAVVPRHM